MRFGRSFSVPLLAVMMAMAVDANSPELRSRGSRPAEHS